MANLTPIEKRKLERLFGMGSGYVLTFTDRTFQEFILDVVGLDIFDKKYSYASGSKANRLRAFWKSESDHTVGTLLNALLEVYKDDGHKLDAQYDECRQIASRLLQGSPVIDIDEIAPIADEREFDLLAKLVKDSIEANQPEAGLDRLHTFVVKFVRVVAEKHNIPCDKELPLHSVFGEYVRFLRQSGLIESDMAERILKSTIANFEAFNRVRNDRTLVHDNRTLDHAESILILNSVASTIRFIKAVERLFEQRNDVSPSTEDDLPF